MFEAVGNVGTTAASAVRAVSAVSPVPAAKEQATTDSPAVPFSPRITADPYTGVVISEYLSSSGEKTIQIPSETVVAYLRSGLTAQGTPVKKEGAGGVTAEA